MASVRLPAALRKIRRLPELWRKTGLALTGFVLWEVGVRIGLPNLDGRVLSDFLRGSGGWLLTLYDRLAGGAISRGAVLALGIMPYVSARIFMRLARVAVPAVGEAWAHEAGRTKLTRWTRVLTVGLGLVQSYGFARFVQTVPGAVTRPGAWFIAETMLALTTGTVCAMVLSEQLTRRYDDDAAPRAEDEAEREADQNARDNEEQVRVRGLAAPVSDDLLLQPGQPLSAEAYQPRRDAVGARRERSS